MLQKNWRGERQSVQRTVLKVSNVVADWNFQRGMMPFGEIAGRTRQMERRSEFLLTFQWKRWCLMRASLEKRM